MEIKLSDIIITDRKRPAKNLEPLKESIIKLGLLQPITISADFRLIAGFHRYSACLALGWEKIPVMVLDLHDLEAELAEIDENLIRNELTTYERSVWQARRKEIYEAMNPEVKHGVRRNPGNQHTPQVQSPQLEDSAQGQSSTTVTPNYSENAAQAQNKSRQTIEREARRGKWLKVFPEIQGTRLEDNGKEIDALVNIADPKSKPGEGIDVARAVLEIALSSKKLTIAQAYQQYKKQRREAEQIAEEVAVPEIIVPVAPSFKVKLGDVWKLGKHRLVCGSCYEIAKTVKADALITDPPYGIDYKPNWNKWDGTPGTFRPIVGDNEEFDPRPFLNFSTVLLFGANYFSDRLPLGGWLCWDKRTREELDAMIGSPFELAWYRSQHTARRSTIIRIQHGGVVNADSFNGNNEKRLHPTQKPIELMREILLSMTKTGETVFEPFAGSGSTLLACQETERICIAVEIEPEYCETILNRFFTKYNIQPCQE